MMGNDNLPKKQECKIMNEPIDVSEIQITDGAAPSPLPPIDPSKIQVAEETQQPGSDQGGTKALPTGFKRGWGPWKK